MSKCKYYRESEIEQYTPECTGVEYSIHPADIFGDYCQLCGKKIKFKELTKIPDYLQMEKY